MVAIRPPATEPRNGADAIATLCEREASSAIEVTVLVRPALIGVERDAVICDEMTVPSL